MQPFTKIIKFRLYTTTEQSAVFKQMPEQYRQACNFVSQYIFDNDFELNSVKLNKILYREVHTQFALKSQLAQSTFRNANARYKTIQTQLVQKHKTLEWLYKPIKFRRPQCDLVRDRDYSFVENGSVVSVNTLDKRVRVNFAGNFQAEYFDGSWSFGTAKLLNLKDIWYLHIPVAKSFEEFSKEEVRHVAGIDSGLGTFDMSDLRRSFCV